jgi:hypothetical protein
MQREQDILKIEIEVVEGFRSYTQPPPKIERRKEFSKG